MEGRHFTACFFFIFIVALVGPCFLFSSPVECVELVDREAMLRDAQLDALNDLYNSLAGSKWINSSGWGDNSDPCGLQKGNSPW